MLRALQRQRLGRQHACRPDGPQFLVVRRFQLHEHFYDVVLRWTAANFPALSHHFCIRHLPYEIPKHHKFVLHLPWLQDPVQKWSPRRYKQARRLAEDCDQLGIPVVNRVDRLLNVSKTAFAERLLKAGLPTPRVARIENPEEFRDTLLGMNLPIFVRDDWGHNQPMLRADTREEALKLPIENIARPVAVELIDVSGHDSLYRKYRYIAAGDIGISHHLQVSRDWITRGRHRHREDRTRDAELAYISSLDPNHAILQRARAAIELDYVAFDYGYDRNGQIIIWEANPYPYIAFSTRALMYRNIAIDRTMAALVGMYLRRAALPVPERLEKRFVYS